MLQAFRISLNVPYLLFGNNSGQWSVLTDRQVEKLEQLDGILAKIIDDWYERVRGNYVTEEDGLELGVEAELKRFHRFGNHRIKFAREKELDVTYGVGAVSKDGRIFIGSSVNNKSAGFDYDSFLEKLKTHYWRSRHEKPWTDPEFDRFTYTDLLPFEPRLGQFVSLDLREEKADIVRLSFPFNPRHEDFLMGRKDVLRDLIENYCLAPLRRIYAECYRQQ